MVTCHRVGTLVKEIFSNPKRRHLREEDYFDYQEGCNSNGACIYDPDAFIFRLQYNGSSNPMKFPVSKASHAGYGKIGYGPTLGRGHDICTFSGTITSSGNAFSLNGHSNLGNSFSLNGENRNTITNNNTKVTYLEVYKVLGKFVITVDVKYKTTLLFMVSCESPMKELSVVWCCHQT